MKIAGRKVFGFIFIMIILSAIIFVLLFVNPELLKVMGTYIVGCMIAAFVILAGSNTADKFITSNFFVKEKWEASNEDT